MDEKLRKWNGWVLGGLDKKKRNLADENGVLLAGNGEEAGFGGSIVKRRERE